MVMLMSIVCISVVDSTFQGNGTLPNDDGGEGKLPERVSENKEGSM